ncbi:hypothetical protein RR48_14635 [Papilio machaon]|uniref:Uncharacterized protein n=1 Tax=Papilio machaon TaxID=76193 RepID=A0A194QKU6_PAPMA|nr:hypothetical protein RR48_14635 [Papilio machaon]
MPGHTGSPYWAAVDFDSEGDDDQSPQSHRRLYLDPWDNDAFGMIHGDSPESSQGDLMNSFAGEPVSASFYYVPTKNYDSGEDFPSPMKRIVPPEDIPVYPMHGRKSSKIAIPEYPDMPIYNTRHIPDRRRSMYLDEPLYAHHPMVYETPYAYAPPPDYMTHRPRMSLHHPPDYMMANLYNKHRRTSRMAEAYEQCVYESLSPEYEDWARPFPKTAPDNFHLSRYGHLQIDYSCSWNSLDRLIRNH